MAHMKPPRPSGDKAKDLDETRRLLYMAAVAPHTEKYTLAGTLINALVHHAGTDTTADDAERHVLEIIRDKDRAPRNRAWLNEQIARITAELEGTGPEER